MNTKKSFFIIILSLMASISSLFSQNNFSISGIVTDTDSYPISGANVVIKKLQKGVSANMDGEFEISNIPSGTYVLEISSLGYATIKKKIELNSDIVQNYVLKDDLLALDELIITGSSNPRKKLESSVAITTMKSEDIQEQAPQSTADLLQSVPGFLVETSGGETGNNLFARGIPSAGAYEYVQFQEDGLPVFEDGALQFANIDNFQRTDLTVSNLEAIKGGSASIYATGAPGGIINFISKTGQNEFEGITKLTVGDYGLFRTDFNLGGSIIEDKLFFNAGGFYRIDDGVRDPGYKANKGGQVKVNLTYMFEKGYARLNYKNLNDRTIFYQSTPFVKDGDKVKEYKGFDANYGTFANNEMTSLRVPQGNGGFFQANLEDGIHPKLTAIGGEFKYQLTDDISFKNSFKSTKIDQDYNAIFAAGWMGGVTSQADYASALGIAAGNARFTYNNGGGELSADTNLKRADLWYINKQMENFANNLTFNFNVDDYMNINLGYYYSNWSSHQKWNWSSFLTSVEDEGRLVNLTDTSNSTNYTTNGVSAATWLQRESKIQGDINAFYADFEIDALENLTINLGGRYDIDMYKGFGDHGSFGNNIGQSTVTSDNGTPANTADDVNLVLDETPNDKFDDGVNILNGDYVHWNYNIHQFSYTAAANYKLNDHAATYARYSRAFRAPIEEAYYIAIESGDGNSALGDLEPTIVNQIELGFKYSSPKVALFANLFNMRLDNISYQDIQAGGVSERKFANVENLGIELETVLKFGDFNATFNGTLQNPVYKGYEGINANGEDQSLLNDNLARRISRFYFNIRPDYNITDKINVYVKYSYFGHKFNDIKNEFKLPAYGVFNAGASYKINDFRLGLDASNLFNTIGLTEGDGAAPTANGDVFLGRSILGRAVKLSLAFNF